MIFSELSWPITQKNKTKKGIDETSKISCHAAYVCNKRHLIKTIVVFVDTEHSINTKNMTTMNYQAAVIISLHSKSCIPCFFKPTLFILHKIFEKEAKILRNDLFSWNRLLKPREFQDVRQKYFSIGKAV